MRNDMALFLYGFDITAANRFIDFKSASLGPTHSAILNTGNYSPTELMTEVKRAMQQADPANVFTVSIDRTFTPGSPSSSNRVVIQTSGPFLSLLFNSGPNSTASADNILGFNHTDRTGATIYTGNFNCGTILVPLFPMWNFLPPDIYITNDGVKNVSSSGVKEALVFAQMRFTQGQWRYISDLFGQTQKTEWSVFLQYATRQKKFEFTPSVEEDSNTFYQVTLESSPADGTNGMAFSLTQMTSAGLYRTYDTGLLKFRLIPGTF